MITGIQLITSELRDSKGNFFAFVDFNEAEGDKASGNCEGVEKTNGNGKNK